MNTTILSLGGSLICPDGIDIPFLKKFREVILDYAKAGNRAIIVTGGGSTSRIYQNACESLAETSKDNLDWIGIAATKLNAQLVRSMFGDLAHIEVLDNPEEHVETDKKIIIGSGFIPGSSSDKDAVLLAKTYSADSVINLTNVDYVYDKNPKEFDDAKAIPEMTWEKFSEMFGTKWKPGLHAPFDPIAAKSAADNNITVFVANGEKLDNLKALLSGKSFVGTRISNK